MKKTSGIPPLLGGSSLLTIFAVLCLTVFALLSVTTVTARQRLSENALASVIAYYEADTQAELVFAQLRNGEHPAGVTRDGAVFRYACPISHNRSLQVELKKEEKGWTVLRWQEVTQPLVIDDSLPVWDGK